MRLLVVEDDVRMAAALRRGLRYEGIVADVTGRRKAWLAVFAALNVVSIAALWWVKPSPDSVMLALVGIAVATIAFEIASVFYNALLPELARETYILPGQLDYLYQMRIGQIEAFGSDAFTVKLVTKFPNRCRQTVYGIGGQPHRFRHIADGAFPMHLRYRCYDGSAVTAVFFIDVLDHLFPAFVLEIDVDVRRLVAGIGHKARK